MPYTEQRITSVRRWSGKTFSFTTTRPDDFQFDNGEFVTLGLKPENKLIARAYSIVSMRNAEHLEFLSIHVPGGPLTSHLARIGEGDSVMTHFPEKRGWTRTSYRGTGNFAVEQAFVLHDA